VAKKKSPVHYRLVDKYYTNPYLQFIGSCKFNMQLMMALDFSKQLKKSSSNENSVINKMLNLPLLSSGLLLSIGSLKSQRLIVLVASPTKVPLKHSTS